MYLSKSDIENSPKRKRINLINSISGIKPGNLIGTKSNSGQSNLAIFSSVVHLGSQPGYFGFFSRPDAEVRRHTYENIKENGYFTINHIHSDIVEKGHYTSAKFDAAISEFDACQLTEEYFHDFKAPFVQESQLKFGLKRVETIEVKSTNTIMVVGEIQHLIIADELVDEQGNIDLGSLNTVGISGLDTYYSLKKIAQFPYARVETVPDFG